jgi:leucyl aminopeptidase
MFVSSMQPDSAPIHLVYEDSYDAWLTAQSPTAQTWARASGFKAERHRHLLLPSASGRVAGVACGLGRRGAQDLSFWFAAGLAERLPDGDYHLATTLQDAPLAQFALGWRYGQYRFERYRQEPRVRVLHLYIPQPFDLAEVERLAAAHALARDLINTPAGDLTPAGLARAAFQIAQRYGAQSTEYVGEELLQQRFPAIHAVGRASVHAPRLIDLHWGDPAHPKVTLIGKGVCFDTGGLDLKPSSNMLLMKKDMGGAACALGLAQAVMDANLPVRLRTLIPAVENAVSGNAFHPGDVLTTRKGLYVEVGNTDAEGRLILCDALTLANEESPDLIVDLATLTGAARVALGPELPALFSNNDTLAGELLRVGAVHSDPLWQLPLWSGYDDELGSKIADLNNVSSSGFSGAIIGGLFLQRFVSPARAWMHIDLYGWNAKERPGRPVGAEPQTIRALYAFLRNRYGA